MRNYVYSVFDKKAGIYSPPFYAPHNEIAMRNVSMAARNLESQLGQYPADFALYRLGYFDDESGLFQTGRPDFLTEVVSLFPAETQLPLFSQEAAE